MSWNLFRSAGDMSRLLCMIELIIRLLTTKNTKGISLRSNELTLLVFVTRYLDLVTSFYSYYNSILKVLYILTAACIVYILRFHEPISRTYSKEQDSFLRWEFIVAPCVVMSLSTQTINYFDWMEFMWMFSIYLESIANVPQLLLLKRHGEVENLTWRYVFFMGAYPVLYVLNWIYRAYTDSNFRHYWVVYYCKALQISLFAVFAYYYIMHKKQKTRSMTEAENELSGQDTLSSPLLAMEPEEELQIA